MFIVQFILILLTCKRYKTWIKFWRYSKYNIINPNVIIFIFTSDFIYMCVYILYTCNCIETTIVHYTF